eukprot:6178436-Prymnesium_polylepis.2
MAPCLPADSFTIGEMRADEYEACLEIAARAFTTTNPAVVHLGIPVHWQQPVTSLRPRASESLSRAAVTNAGRICIASSCGSSPPRRLPSTRACRSWRVNRTARCSHSSSWSRWTCTTWTYPRPRYRRRDSKL